MSDDGHDHAGALHHVELCASDLDAAVDSLTDGVRAREDARVLYPDRHPYAGGYYALYCAGPDGVVVEVVGPDA